MKGQSDKTHDRFNHIGVAIDAMLIGDGQDQRVR
jgi:hypothetical protein